MAGVVWWRAGEAREGEVPGAGGGSSGCCEGCEGYSCRPEPIVAGCESRCASEANLHGEWVPRHQNRILMSDCGSEGRRRPGVVRSGS